MKEAREWLSQTRDFTSKHQIERSIQEIVKTFEGKKTITWAKDYIEKGESVKIDVSEQISAIQNEIKSVEQWDYQYQSSGSGMELLIEAIKAMQHIKLRSPNMGEFIQTFKQNQDWILQSLSLMNDEQKKHNQLKDLQNMIKKVKEIKNNVYSQKLLKDLQKLEAECLKQEDLIQNHDFTQSAILSIRDASKILTVRPLSYHILKKQEKIIRWMNKDSKKLLSKLQLEDLIKEANLNEKIIESANEKFINLKNQLEEIVDPLKDKILNIIESIEAIVTSINLLEVATEAISKEFQIQDTQIQNYILLKEWLLKLQNAISKQNRSKSKDSPQKAFNDQLSLISKDNMSKLVNKFQPIFSQICGLAESVYSQIRSSKNTKDCQETLSKNKINLKKLEQLLQKSQTINDPDKQKEIKKQIEQVNSWFKDFKEQCHLTESILKKELKSNPQSLLKNATNLIERRNCMKLELSSNEEKILLKVRKWSQIVCDAIIVMKDKAQTQINQDRIYDLKTDLERMKSLDEIEQVGKLKQEFKKIDDFHKQLDEISNIEEGSIIDRDQLKKTVSKYEKLININIQNEFDELNYQINTNEEWEKKANEVIEDKEFSNFEEANKLCELIAKDRENYQLFKISLIDEIQIYAIKAKFRELKNNKKDVVDFILAMEKEILKIKNHEQISEEVKMLELAKNMKKTFSKSGTLDKQRSLTLNDAISLIDNQSDIPFIVDKKKIENIKKDIKIYNETLIEKAQLLYSEVPEIGKYDDLLKKLQELSFVSPDETFILKMKGKYSFIMEKVQQYPEEEQKEYKQDESIGEKEPRFITIFQKVYKKFQKLKCQCPNGQRLVNEYLQARVSFDNLKQSFSLIKLQSPTYAQLASIYIKLIDIRLDFEDEELVFRREIWHERVRKLVADFQNKNTSERQPSDFIKAWLEEGQELEVVNDSKYEKLNEIVEDIDFVSRALKLCETEQEIDLIAQNEEQGIIDFTNLIKIFKKKLADGELPKINTKKGAKPRTSSEPLALEYLKNMRSKKQKDEGNQESGKDVTMEDATEQDEDDGTDLEEEKEDEPAEEEGGEQPKKTKKRSSSSAAPKKRTAVSKSKVVQSEKTEKLRVQKAVAKKIEGLNKATKTITKKKPEVNKEKATTEAPKKKIVKKVEKQTPVEGIEKKEKEVKPKVKGMGGGIKLGGGLKNAIGGSNPPAAKVPIKGIMKKKFSSPSKEVKKTTDIDGDEKMEGNGEKQVVVDKDVEETTDHSENKQEKTVIKPKEKTKEKQNLKEEKSSSLLKKRPLPKSAPTKEKVKKDAEKDEEQEKSVKIEKKEPKEDSKLKSDKPKEKAKIGGIVKKTGGGGLAASLAKMK